MWTNFVPSSGEKGRVSPTRGLVSLCYQKGGKKRQRAVSRRISLEKKSVKFNSKQKGEGVV